jgi:hypothetical protein
VALRVLKPSSGDGEFLGAHAQEFVIPQNWGQCSLSLKKYINISIRINCGFDRGRLCVRVWDGTDTIPPKADTMPAGTSAFRSIVLRRRKKMRQHRFVSQAAFL